VKTKGLVIVGIMMVVISLAAVQAFALPQYHGWGSRNRTSTAMTGGMNTSGACSMMNSQEMLGSMMNGQSMNAQQCQQHMASGGSQMMNGQGQQQCQQQMGTNHNMTAEQCQAIH